MTLIMSIVISITFLIVRLLLGDPPLVVGDRPTLEQIEKAQNDFGFNKPLHIQYISFLKKTISLDLGVSLRTKQPVLITIRGFPSTFLSLFSFHAHRDYCWNPNGNCISTKKGEEN